jgi:hypothetical protein
LRSSKLRQYCTIAGPWISVKCHFSSPCCGCLSSQRSIFGIAMNTGSHLSTRRGRLNRIPIRKTTNSSGIDAENRPR